MKVAQSKGWADSEPLIQLNLLGSSAYSNATRKKVAETRQLGNGARFDSLNYERESPRKSVAGEARVLRVEQELGGLGGRGGKGVGRAVGEASPEPQNERRCGVGGGVL